MTFHEAFTTANFVMLLIIVMMMVSHVLDGRGRE